MKKVASLLLISLTLLACEKEASKPWNPDAKVYISSSQTTQSVVAKATPVRDGEQQKLTPLEIVQQSDFLTADNGTLFLDDDNRDFERVRIVGPAMWVIIVRGPEIVITKSFICGRNTILETRDPRYELGHHPLDTIAYIPNAIMIETEAKIRAAFAVQDYDACYKIFEEAFVFTPITGKEYLELQAKGLN